MGAEKADHHHAVLILHHGDQAIIIRLDVKDHPAGFEDARLWMSLFYVLRRLPLRTRRDGPPGIVLRPSRLCLSLKRFPELVLGCSLSDRSDKEQSRTHSAEPPQSLPCGCKREYMRALAELGEGVHRSGEVAELIGKATTSLSERF